MESPTETENLVLSPYSLKQASKLPSLLKKTGKRYRVNLMIVLILLSIPVSSYRTLKLLSFLPAPWPIGAGWLRHSSGPLKEVFCVATLLSRWSSGLRSSPYQKSGLRLLSLRSSGSN